VVLAEHGSQQPSSQSLELEPTVHANLTIIEALNICSGSMNRKFSCLNFELRSCPAQTLLKSSMGYLTIFTLYFVCKLRLHL